MNNSRKIFFSTAVAALLVAGILGYLFIVKQQREHQVQREFSAAFNEGRELMRTGRSGSSARFEDALDKAQTKQEEAIAKLNLGVSYLSVDRITAVNVLKQVSLDESYPSFYRAGAAEQILRHFMGNRDIAFAFEHIFTGPQWGTFAEGVSRDREGAYLAARRGFEWTVSLYSIFTAEYRIASWYASKILQGELSSTTTDAYLDVIAERVAAGDAAFALAAADPSTLKSQLGLGYILKGIALEALHAGGKVSIDDVKRVYEKAIPFTEQDPGDVSLAIFSPYARFQYAAFLVRVSGESERELIEEVLGPLYSETTSGGFYQYAGTLHDESLFSDDPGRTAMLNVAEFDPRFKTLLLSVGWSEDDF